MNEGDTSLGNAAPVALSAECRAYWQRYIATLPATHPHHAAQPDAFAFGGGGALADELAALVLSGRKCATTSLAVEYTRLGEALPRAGDISIILDGDARPVAIIERTSVEIRPFDTVTLDYARIEGEGDGSLEYWRAAHVEYFGDVCASLGDAFSTSTSVICQVFRLAWHD